MRRLSPGTQRSVTAVRQHRGPPGTPFCPRWRSHPTLTPA